MNFGVVELIVTSLMSIAAACLGFCGQHVISEWTKRKENLQKEFRQTNVATSLSFDLCSAVLLLKEFSIRPLIQDYIEKINAYNDFSAQNHNKKAAQNRGFELEANFRIINFSKPSTSILESKVYEETPVDHCSIQILSTLSRTLKLLVEAITFHNELVMSYQSIESHKISHLYFGLETQGNLNKEYPDVMLAIETLTDDAIFFSKMLCEKLHLQAENVRAELKKHFSREQPPAAHKADFTAAIEKELIPDPKNYKDWYANQCSCTSSPPFSP